MGFWTNLIDRIEAKIDRPADQSVLSGERNPGSQSIVTAGSPEAGRAAAANVRRRRDRRRWRWGGHR